MSEEFISEYPGNWVLVKSMGESYIGRLKESESSSIVNDGILLSPCYEYMSNLASDGQGGLSRNTAAIPLDLVLDDCPVHLKVSFLIYMNEMSEADCEEYKRITQKCVEIINNTQNMRRQARSGIQIISTMPGSNGGGMPGDASLIRK
jgi:hypothetical protein